jgi:hypothetical protein
MSDDEGRTAGKGMADTYHLGCVKTWVNYARTGDSLLFVWRSVV